MSVCVELDDDLTGMENTVISTCSSDESHQKEVMEKSKAVMQCISRTMQSGDAITTFKDDDPDTNDIAAVLQEVKPNPPCPTRTQRAIQGTVEVVKKTNKTSKSMGVASIAGGIAGATAGLIVGGPAGAYVGIKIGQAIGIAGVLIEGTIGVGVLVAGVTGTVLTVKQLKGGENRMVTIGGKGSENVVLVRPNVFVDPIWEEITMNARRSAPTDNVIAGLALFGDKKVGRKERQKRDRDIVYSEEDEINTREKVFLLVCSSLNDKNSLPGHVSRELIGEAKNRAESRKRCVKDGEDEIVPSRAIRQDVHGIIKHITATLLEVRPGFCSSP